MKTCLGCLGWIIVAVILILIIGTPLVGATLANVARGVW